MSASALSSSFGVASGSLAEHQGCGTPILLGAAVCLNFSACLRG